MVVVAASLFTYVVVTSQRAGVEKGAEEAMETGILPPLAVYIQSCIDLESPPVIFKVAEQGGVLEPKEGSYLEYEKEKLNYLCLIEGPRLEFACVNAFLSRQELQRILSKEIANNLGRCINLKAFEAQGYKIDAKKISVRTRIGKKSVLVEVNYPINMSKEDEVVTVSDFNSEVKLPLGDLYETAMDIVNKEIKEGYFDIDGWMVANGADIIIEKHRPYPNKVYIISEKISESFKKFNKNSLKFQFVIQQNPSIAQKRPKQELSYGMCKNQYDDTCFENVQEAYCRQVDGSYIPSSNRGCTENFRQPVQKPELCSGHNCKDCEYDIWGIKFDIPKKHGESWCVYDTITGKGYDYVGSRHYKHGCIDGNVYLEECRDYREEFCTENFIGNMNKAVCRVNRWTDCSYCESEECCNDLRYRDCFWNFESTLKQKCVPYVPPGLRFWENEGIDVCLRANNKKDCEGISCPNVWIDDNARYCYQQADCGNYRNIADQVTYQGFFQTDPVDSVRHEIFLNKRWNRNPLEDGRGWWINLPIDTTEQPNVIIGTTEVNSLVGNIPVMLSAALEFIDEIANLDVSDFLNPFTPMPKIHIVDFTFCSVWTAPIGKNYCVLCGADPARPCSEYKCKSLGERCDFRMEEGIPYCELPSLVDKEPPKIEFNKEALKEGYKAEKAGVAGHTGVKITPSIIPHRPFTFGIKTTELTRCRIKLSPRLPYFSLPSFWLNDPSFKTEHNLTIRMPPKLSIPQKLFDMLNISSTSKLITLLENIEPTYEYYKEKFADKIQIYTSITGDDLIGKIDSQVKPVIDFINALTPYLKTLFTAMIEQFDRGGYYIFTECTDQAGNKNKDEFFVQFEVDANYTDNEPPVIVQAFPENNSRISKTENLIELTLYVDEPAECRYSLQDWDFEYMEKSFVCNTGYHISPVAGGTYECTALVDRTIYPITYVRCKDRPIVSEDYTIKFYQSDNLSINGLDELNATGLTNPAKTRSDINTTDYLRVIEPNRIEVPGDMLSMVEFNVSKLPVDLTMYINENLQCRYSNQSEPFEKMNNTFEECILSDHVQRGIYECNARIGRTSERIKYGLDVVIAIDASGSMWEEMRAVKTQTVDIIKEIEKKYPQAELRVGLIVYGDSFDIGDMGQQGKEFGSFRRYELTDDLGAVSRNLMDIRMRGGMEFVGAALCGALNKMNWDEGGNKMVFLIGDEPGDAIPFSILADFEGYEKGCAPDINYTSQVEIAMNKKIPIYAISTFDLVSMKESFSQRGMPFDPWYYNETIKRWKEISTKTNARYENLEYKRVDVDEYYEEKEASSEWAQLARTGLDYNISDNTILVSNLGEIMKEIIEEEAAKLISNEYYIKCADPNASTRNVNTESYVYTLAEAEPLTLTVTPSGVVSETETELIVKVSGSISADKIVCGYNDNPFYGMLNMDKVASDRFGVHLTGLEDGKKYAYYINCYDRYENEAEGYTEFEVIV
ncbi:hypothetical protein ACFL6I_24305 [candidate division KSB1 bacterium]